MKRILQEIKRHTPTVDTHYRIGMRVVKTAAAVGICLLFAHLWGGIESILITAVATIVTIRATQEETILSGMFRILGTIIGAALGGLTVLISLHLPFYNEGLFVIVIPLVLLLNLYICNVLNMQDSCSISCVVTIIVATQIAPIAEPMDEALAFALLRVRDTFVGVFVATVMNIAPYAISGKMHKHKQKKESE
ncbi:MAG: aromatic acid exporter family protein [Oscillospiraceae bacterium]|nr:aromatic acid exporter family protein [Oscillospiraceae bacterium]